MLDAELDACLETDMLRFLDNRLAPAEPDAVRPDPGAPMPFLTRDYEREINDALDTNEILRAKRALRDLKHRFDEAPTGTAEKNQLKTLLVALYERFRIRVEHDDDQNPVDTDLAKAERSLDRDEQRLDDLELIELSDFPKAVQLKDLSNEVSRLRREIKEAETSPEALARDAARAERAAAKGREPKWSLMLNPTPSLVEELGMGSADDVRAMMHDKAIAAQHAAAQSTAGHGQLESGDTSTRPGNFLRAVDDEQGTAKPWKNPEQQGPEPGHEPENGYGLDT